jgi:tetratricopeptide (TPR) repeat protein
VSDRSTAGARGKAPGASRGGPAGAGRNSPLGSSLRLLAPVAVFLLGCKTYSPLDSHYNRGVEFYDRGRLAEAIREYRMAIEDDPKHARAHFNLGVCFHDQGKLEDAAAEYGIVLRLSPEDARSLVSLASIRLEENKNDEALALLGRAAEADPHSGFPKSAAGTYYERKGDLEVALRAYRDSVALEPGHAAGHAGIARILLRRDETDGAIAELDLALGAEPDDVSVLLLSAEAREKKGDAKGATLHLERALVHVRDRAALWIRLADLYEHQGRLEDAVASLWEARGVDRSNPDVGPRLKRLYAKLASRE